MNDLLQDFHDYLHDQDKSEQTIRAYMADLRTFSRWFHRATGEPIHPQNITPVDAINYRTEMLDQGKKPSTINRSLISISCFCQWAQRNEVIPNNPVERIRGVAEEPLGPRALGRKEQLALLRAARRSRNVRDFAIITLLLHTGIRVGELCSLRFKHIAISDDSSMLTIEKGKGVKRRTVPLNPTVVEALHAYLRSLDKQTSTVITAIRPDQNRSLFYGQKRMPLTDRGVRYMIKKYAYTAKIPNLSPHVLRHTCAKNLIDAGNSIDKVSKILGHASVNTTSVYTMPNERDLKMTMDSISWE